MTLLLQPVFVDLNPPSTPVPHVTSSVTIPGPSSPARGGQDPTKSNHHPADGESSGSGSIINPQGDPALGTLMESAAPATSALAEDRLHSMWKVATKVKSVMADGARFENLTWRAWYRKNQLEKIERERRQVADMQPVSGTSEEPAESTAMPLVTGSQATAIPGRSLSIKAPGYGSGYSTILAEIQEASVRRASTLMPGISPADSSVDSRSYSRQQSAAANTNASSVEAPIEGFAASIHSTTSISTTAINSSKSLRRRKKNVDKFIKRQQLQQQQPHLGQASHQQPLERICEEAGTPIASTAASTHAAAMDAKKVLEGAAKPLRPRGKMEETSSFTTNDTISGGSLGDTGERQPVVRPKSEGLTFALRRSEHIGCKGSSPSSGERPNVSLLTMLLNRGGAQEARRSESCPPPILSMSPPTRPGAPVPIEVAMDGSDHTLNLMAVNRRSPSKTPHEPMATPPSPPVAVSGSRRRPAPKTADFTTPLFIW